MAKQKLDNFANRQAQLARMHAMVDEAMAVLADRNCPYNSYRRTLARGLASQGELSPVVSSAAIDEFYERGRKAGAIGGKLLGAGSGGFFSSLSRRSAGLRCAKPSTALSRSTSRSTTTAAASCSLNPTDLIAGIRPSADSQTWHETRIGADRAADRGIALSLQSLGSATSNHAILGGRRRRPLLEAADRQSEGARAW